MGIAISDFSTADILFQLNTRFGPGQPLREMVAIQRDFKVKKGAKMPGYPSSYRNNVQSL